MTHRNIHGTPQLTRCGDEVSASSFTGIRQAGDMTASPTTSRLATQKPADAWVPIGDAVQAVLAKLKVAHDPRA